MPVIPFPGKTRRARRVPAESPERRLRGAVNELVLAFGEEEVFHLLADLAEKMRKSMRKAHKQRKT